MSYDIYLRAPEPECPTCKRPNAEPDLPEPTYNLSPIFDLALTGDEAMPNAEIGEAAVVLFKVPTDRPRGLRVLSGRVARETIEQIDQALVRLADPDMAAKFRALEPPNGWGTHANAISVMRKLRDAAESYPNNTWEIH